MKFTLMPKSRIIVTLLGVAFLTVAVGVTSYLTQSRQSLRSLAGGAEVPKEVKITNLTENSVSVSWITDVDVIGSVNYGIDTTLGVTALEDRIGAAKTSVHHVTLKPLQPATTYYFKISSGKGQYGQGANAYVVKTPSLIGTPPPPQTVYGTLINPDSSVFGGRGVVYVDTLGGGTASTVINPANGNWSVSISTIRTKDLNSYVSLGNNTSLTLFVQAGEAGTSRATVKLVQTQPVPTMTLGETYNFEPTDVLSTPKPPTTPTSSTSGTKKCITILARRLCLP